MTSQPRPDPATITEARYERLRSILEACGSVCIGYSGGVDSVFLAHAAVRTLGADRVLAVTGRSASFPEAQREVAAECAARFGIPHLEVDTLEVSDPRYAANPSNRCYYCKSELWRKLVSVARERGLAVVLDGSNADDAADYRPGFAAAAENGVCSPLLEAGLTKDDIRALSRREGLPTWDQPSAPCLASRLPYGIAVTPARLRQVELAEAALRELGFAEFRVRHHDDCLRLEFAPAELDRATLRAAAIVARLRALRLPRLLLDAEGYRRGALNEALVQIGSASAAGATADSGPGADTASRVREDATDDVEALGFHRDIAVLATGSRADARAAAASLRTAGFRYVALDLDVLASDTRQAGRRRPVGA
jgi:pyridinium-3,5-biscarboxylic acid mononucleotide sulfurtransferase